MFPRGSFHGHLNIRFCLWSTLNNVIDLVDFLCTNGREYFFNLDDFQSIGILLRDLGVRFSRLLRIGCLLVALEKDNIDLFLRFSWNGQRDPFDVGWDRLIDFLFVFSRSGGNFWSELD